MNRAFSGYLSALFVVLFLAAFSAVQGQDLDNVVIYGKIIDSNKMPVAGAVVTATLAETGIERNVVTNEDGEFRFIQLVPGVYSVKVESAGFGTRERANIRTISAQQLQLDFTLNPADVQVGVTVTEDDAPLVDTTRTIVGSTIESRDIEELPSLDRNALDLVMTLGGVSEEALSTSDLAEDRNADPSNPPFEQGNFSISGGASYSNNITIDGLDNNDDRAARDRFQPSLESIAEVQVVRNQFSAEYGRASGGRVNLRTRGGSNRYRGRAFMFYRNDIFNANTWYNNNRGINRLPMTNYTPGITYSGPVKLPFYNGTNRTFFFAAYELQQFNDTTQIDTFVPVDPNPNFELPGFNVDDIYCDQTGTSRRPPCNSEVGLIAPFRMQMATPNQGHIASLRFDHKLTDNNNMTVGAQFGRRVNRRTRGASTTRLEEALQARRIETEAINLTNNHTFGANLVNQFRIQWSSYRPSFETDNPGESVVLIGYRNPITLTTQTLISGNSSSSSNVGFADNRDETRVQVQNSISYVRGNHSLKFGGDVQYVDSKANNLADGTGTFNFNNVYNYTNNTVTRFRQNFGTRTDVTNTYWALFINDEFRLRPNLSFTLGLRYEQETAVSDKNNFGPRLGIAWDPSKRGNEVIRFGAGIVYNRVLLRTVGDFIQNQRGGMIGFDTNSIPTANNARNNILASISQQFPNGFPTMEALQSLISQTQCGNSACSPTLGFTLNDTLSGVPLRAVESGIRIPESYQFNIGYERQIGKDWVFETNYTLNKTAHLWREYNSNLPILPSGYDDFTEYLLNNDFQFVNFNGSIRTYKFWLGTDSTTNGLSTAPNSATGCPTSGAANMYQVGGTCYVNLGTFNSSVTVPNSNASDGVSSNSLGTPIGIAREAIRHLRPIPEVDEFARVASLGNSFYQGLTVEFRRRYRQIGHGFGLSFRSAYTLSRTMDDGLNNTSNAEIDGDFSREWARARQDRLHRLAVSGTVEVPRWAGKLRFTPVFRYGSASRFNLGIGSDRNLNNQSTDRINFSGNLKDIRWVRPGSPIPYELLSQFSLQPIGSKGGNLPRNAGIGPSQYIFDIGITREWRIGERMRLRPNVQIGNVFNMVVFSYGSEFINYAATVAGERDFLIPTRTYRQRDMRFGVRFDF